MTSSHTHPPIVAALRLTFSLTEEWACQCGAKHSFGHWAAAHWDEGFVHDCDCGLRHTFVAGRVKRIRPRDGETFTARRENGPHHDPEIAKTYGSYWVVRDPSGTVIDWDRYRHDLADRYTDLVIVDEEKTSVEG